MLAESPAPFSSSCWCVWHTPCPWFVTHHVEVAAGWACISELSENFSWLIYCKLNCRFMAMIRELWNSWVIGKDKSIPAWVKEQRLASRTPLLLMGERASQTAGTSYFWWLNMCSNRYYCRWSRSSRSCSWLLPLSLPGFSFSNCFLQYLSRHSQHCPVGVHGNFPLGHHASPGACCSPPMCGCQGRTCAKGDTS